MKLWDNITITRYDYSRKRRIPYCIDRNTPVLAVSETKMYMLTKVWNKCLIKADKVAQLMLASRRYDKVKLHRGCVYASRRYI